MDRSSVDAAVGTRWPGLEVLAEIEGGHRNRVWRGRLGDGDPVAIRISRRSADSLAWEVELLKRLSEAGFHVPTPVLAEDGSSFVSCEDVSLEVRHVEVRHVEVGHVGVGHVGVGHVVVQRWIDGREPATADEWRLVADELQRLHALDLGLAQRPDCCRLHELPLRRRCVDADLDRTPAEVVDQLAPWFRSTRFENVSVIHGDPWAPNLRITDDGRVGLLDWDESRIDVTLLDLADLGPPDAPIEALPPQQQERARSLANAWEAANGWIAEPVYAAGRLARLGPLLHGQ